MKELNDLHKEGFVSDKFKEELKDIDETLVEIERKKSDELKNKFDNMDCSGLCFS